MALTAAGALFAVFLSLEAVPCILSVLPQPTADFKAFAMGCDALNQAQAVIAGFALPMPSVFSSSAGLSLLSSLS